MSDETMVEREAELVREAQVIDAVRSALMDAMAESGDMDRLELQGGRLTIEGSVDLDKLARAAIEAFEQGLRAHLKGEHSSLTLGFNDSNGPNYMSVKSWQEEGPSSDPTDWVSEAEKTKAAETNSMWTLHWYPDTPVGFYCTGASSILALFEAAT